MKHPLSHRALAVFVALGYFSGGVLLSADFSHVARTARLFLDADNVIEVRAKTEGGIASGYFSDAGKLVQAVRPLDPKSQAIYLTLNPVNPDLLARASNRVKQRVRVTTIDADILRRRLLLLDFDAKRPAEISSTEAEHQAALDVARNAAAALQENGWPEPVVADSGNGAHLLFRIDLPNDQASTDIIKAVLRTAAQRFNAGDVQLDLSVHNASRISKLYGTVARKGDSTPQRPHRVSRLISVPDRIEIVSPTLLNAFCSQASNGSAPAGTARDRRERSSATFSLERFLADHGIDVHSGPVIHDGSEKWVLEHCPFNPSHAAPDAAVFRQLGTGRLGFRCLHNSCEGNGWEQFRAFYDGRAKRDRSVSSPAAAAPEALVDWQASLIRSNGRALPVLANAITLFSHHPALKGMLAFDEFSVRAEFRRGAPWGTQAGASVSDNDYRRGAEFCQRQGVLVNTVIAGEAMQTVALENRFHRLQVELSKYVWDGKPRVRRVASSYLGVDADRAEICDKFVCIFMLGAVARAFCPGAKVDTILVLEGRQGSGKSSFLRAIAGRFFTDQISDLGTKDSYLQCQGAWIIELSELDSISRAEVSRIKAFATSCTDRFRLPYGRTVVEWPRGCVFAGTTNSASYLRDETGARRFLPVKCGDIDLASVLRDREQLWAEAAELYRNGAQWWLHGESVTAAAEAEQRDRYQPGQWDSAIADWVDAPQERLDGHGNPVASFTSTRESVSIDDVLSHCLGKPRAQWTRADQVSVATALRALGWERYRQRNGNTLAWRYRKAAR